MNQEQLFDIAALIVIDHYNITKEELCSKSREKLYVDARYMVIVILYENSVYGSLKKLGERLGNRSHATIINGIQKLNDYVEFDKPTRDLFNNLNNKFQQLCM